MMQGSSLSTVMAGGIRWFLPAQHHHQLLGPQGLRLKEWLRAGQARVVKDGPHRTVYAVDLPGLRFYLKHNRLMDLRAWLRQLVRPAKARLEFDRGSTAAARRIATISFLGYGETKGPWPGESYLLTLTLDRAVPLNAFLEQQFPLMPAIQQTLVRQHLAKAMGKFMAQVHEAGIAHHDLHAGNILIRLEGDQPALFLIDLHAVRIGQNLDWPKSWENLVLLNRWFVLAAHRTDRMRFWRAYAQTRGVNGLVRSPKGNKQLPLELERRTWESNLLFWRHRRRRFLTSNRHIQKVSSTETSGFAIQPFDEKILAPFLADPDEPFHRPGVKILKDSPSSTVAELELHLNGSVQSVIYKRFRVTSWKDPWVNGLRNSAALRSWILGHGFKERNLPTPRPLAVIHRRKAGRLFEGYLLTQKVQAAVDLKAYLANLQQKPNSHMILRQRIDQLAKLIRELHQCRLSHRDLKAANILVSGAVAVPLSSSPTPTLSPYSFIDLVGVHSYPRLSRYRRQQNLARLHASFFKDPLLTRTDKLRFLRAYMQWGLLGKGGWKNWWRKIRDYTQVKTAQNVRRGRPLS